MDAYYADPYKDLTPEERAAIHHRLEQRIAWDDLTEEEQHGVARRMALSYLRTGRRPAAWFRQACADENEPLYDLVADIMDEEVAAREARGRFQVLRGEHRCPGPWR